MSKQLRLLAILTALAMVISFPPITTSAFTGSGTPDDPICWDLSADGNLKIDTGDKYYTVTSGTTTDAAIIVEGGITTYVTLENVSIDVSDTPNACAFKITGDSTVCLTLKGSNFLKSGDYRAGLEVSGNNKLIITGTSDGTLTANGGAYGAGIGGGDDDGGNIDIRNGNVTANGGAYGAGIGGGDGGTGGNVIISSGKVIATGGFCGAGIGGGCNEAGGDITISGGDVTAKGGDSDASVDGGASGIGGGYGGDGGTVNISGGNVIAIGGDYGAGIGGGCAGAGGNVIISGGDVTATGGDNDASDDGGASGIGGGDDGDGGTVSISGGNVIATGGKYGAGIGGGDGGDGGTINISGGNIEANSVYYGAGIGGGDGGDGGTINISGGRVTATVCYGGAGIGGGNCGGGGIINIGGNAVVIAYGGDAISDESHGLGGGAGIGGGGGLCIVEDDSSYNYPSGDSGEITINGSSSVTANGGDGATGCTHYGHGGAAIGSGGAACEYGAGAAEDIDVSTGGGVTVTPGEPGGSGSNGGASIGEGGTTDGTGISTIPVINATAGPNGKISPSGSSLLVKGSDQTYTITPDLNCKISRALIDGVNNPAVVASGKYTFTNVTSDHRIHVDFTAPPYPQSGNSGRDSRHDSWLYSGFIDGWAYIIGSGKPLVHNTDKSLSLFIGAEVDGIAIHRDKQYKLTSGSTVVTLFPEYLDTLPVGLHTLTVLFRDGVRVNESFTVEERKTVMPAMEPASGQSATVSAQGSFSNYFTDVQRGAWYYGGVQYVFTHNLMIGTSDNPLMFSPNAPLTRGMIVAILYRHSGSPGASWPNHPFTDVDEGKWYSDAVKWAAANGIVSGYNGRFDPEAGITRQDLASILWRYAKFIGMDVSAGENGNISSFADATDVSEYALPAMQWAYDSGIISGKPGGMSEQLDNDTTPSSGDMVGQSVPENFLDPKGQATRAEMAVMLQKMFG